jgi:hypothetical protein
VRFENKKLAYNFTQVFFISENFLPQNLKSRSARFARYAPTTADTPPNNQRKNRQRYAFYICHVCLTSKTFCSKV